MVAPLPEHPPQGAGWLPGNFWKNLGSLFGVQFVGYILPWITIPYLVRVIGVSKFGILAFASAVVQYCILVSDYGYSFIGPREVALRHDQTGQLQPYFSRTFWTRSILATLSFCVLALLTFIVPLFRPYTAVLLLTFGSAVANIFLPLFVFQGLEILTVFSRITILGQALGTAGIFVFIRNEPDYLYVPLIYSSTQIACACFASIYLRTRHGLRIGKPSLHAIREELRGGFRVFLSSGSITVYTTMNTVILGLFAPAQVVGWYSAGEKTVRAIRGAINPFVLVLFAHVSRLAEKSKLEARAFLRRIGARAFPLGVVASVLLFLGADEIVSRLFGPAFHETAVLLRLLSPMPSVFVAVGLYSDLFLLAFGERRSWSMIVITAAAICLVLNLVFVGLFRFGHLGAGASFLLTESSVGALAWSAWHREKESPGYE